MSLNLDAAELERKAVELWYAGNLEEARELHEESKKLEPEAEWILNNDYWFYTPDFRINFDDINNSTNTKYLNAKISVLIVGHGRPEGAMRTASTAKVTASQPELVEVLICADNTDPLVDRYLNLPELTVFSIPQKETSTKWNFLFERATGDIFVMVPDDVIFESWGWDDILRKIWPDNGIAVMYSDDNKGNELLEFPIISRSMAERVGYVACPKVVHAGIDVLWFVIGKKLGRLYYLANVWKLRHQHYQTNSIHNRSTRPPFRLRDFMDTINSDVQKILGS